jgi:hypothetical protein
MRCFIKNRKQESWLFVGLLGYEIFFGRNLSKLWEIIENYVQRHRNPANLKF